MNRDSTIRISLWSGPRNISTALMYSFAQRGDARVFDEPLYAHYLASTDARNYHPGAEEVLASQENDGEKVVRDILLGDHDAPVVFFKNMTHHLVNLDWSFLKRLTNVLLTRDPVDMLPSYADVVKAPTLRDTGYADQVALLNYLMECGQEPPVLVADQVLRNPRRVLSRLCERIGIPFDEAMLRWEAGPRPEDGVWAKHWYGGVHRSTGFNPNRPKTEPFPERLKPLLETCRPYFEHLRELAITAD